MTRNSKRLQSSPRTSRKKHDARVILGRRRFDHFIKLAHPTYKMGWAQQLIANKLQKFYEDVEAEASPRLMIFLPPRHSKSLTVSQLFPPWVLGQDPTKEIVVASYALSLPAKFSRSIREIVRADPLYHEMFPDTRLHPDVQSVEGWETTLGGGFRPVGRGGSLTGKGAHCVSPTAVASMSDGTTLSAKKLFEEFPQNPSLKVLCYYKGSITEKRLTSAIKVESNGGYRVRLRGGIELPATGDHPVCVGFSRDGRPVCVRVADLRPGTRVVKLKGGPGRERPAGISGMPGVRGGVHKAHNQAAALVSQAGHLLQQVFREAAEAGRSGGACLRSLWGRIRGHKETSGAGEGEVLQPEVLWDVEVRHSAGGCASELEPGGAGLHSVPEEVSKVPGTGRPPTDGETVLLEGLLLGVHKGGGYTPYPVGDLGFAILSPGVQEAALLVDASGGVDRVRSVRWAGPGPAPQGWRQNEQQLLEFGTVVSVVPQEGTQTFYDFEVEEAHNLFFNSIHSLNCLIVDDILKDAEEADSPVVREAAMDWYSSTAYTRLYPGGGVVLVSTRWHLEDLPGALLTHMENANKAIEDNTMMDGFVDPKDVDQWDILCLPAVAEKEEYLSPDHQLLYTGDEPPEDYDRIRNKGDALHPERYTRRLLNGIKATLQPRHWQALYQQAPMPEGGAFFEIDKIRFGVPPDLENCNLVITADTASSTDQSADDSCIMAVAMDAGRNVWVVDAVADKINVFAFVETLIDFYVKYPDVITVGIESGGLREAIMPILEQRMLERGVFLPLADKKEMRPMVSKEIRARPAQGIVQTLRLWLPKEKHPWVSKLVNQMRRFPQWSEDDMVDTLAWAVRVLLSRGLPVQKRRQKPIESWKARLRTMSRAKRTYMSG